MLVSMKQEVEAVRNAILENEKVQQAYKQENRTYRKQDLTFF